MKKVSVGSGSAFWGDMLETAVEKAGTVLWKKITYLKIRSIDRQKAGVFLEKNSTYRLDNQ